MATHRVFSICRILLSVAILTAASQEAVQACACGCGVFDVGTSSMLPTHEGGVVYFEADSQNQDRNWRGSSPSPADANSDKKIISHFFSVGARYLFNRSWGLSVQIPYATRYLKAADESTGDLMEFDHSSIGDIRLKGLYTGLSKDMSTGFSFGVKLPTGDYRYEHFDPDIQIGSGSTDLLLGVYHMGQLVPSGAWNYFANAEADVPVLHYEGYIPGSEVNAAAGVYFNQWQVGRLKIAPVAQVVGTHRWSDAGDLALSESTGYSRVLVAPGLEVGTETVRLYTDVGFRVYQYTTGDQLIASQFFKLNISYHF